MVAEDDVARQETRPPPRVHETGYHGPVTRRQLGSLGIALITPSCGSGSSASPNGNDGDAGNAGTAIYGHGGRTKSMSPDSGGDSNIALNRDANEADADTRPMLRLDWGGAAVVHDAQGNEIWRANAPTKFPLPDGGAVHV